MKKPPLSLLISDPSNNSEFKIPFLRPEVISWLVKKLKIDIYKRLFPNPFIRVINVYKCVLTLDVIINQKFVKFNEVAPMGEMRI